MLVTARSGDTGQAIADSYGVDLSALSPSRAGALPPGAVLRVSLSALPRSAAGRLPPGVQVYRVRSGDTLERVALAHDLSVTQLLSANLHLQTLDKLALNDVLYLPQSQAGLLVRIKVGQTAAALVKSYHADPAQVAFANGFGLPSELKVGDYLLLPGVLATGFRDQLRARLQRQVEAQRQARVQRQFERFVAYQQRVKREQAARQQAIQLQYEKYLAWQRSPEHLREVARYQAQARFEAAQRAARLAKQQAIQLQYQKYLAWQHSPEHLREVARYQAQARFEAAQRAAKLARQQAVQLQYEKYLAWQHSAARQRLIAQYAAQARYDAAQRAARAQAQALAAARVSQSRVVVRPASTAQASGPAAAAPASTPTVNRAPVSSASGLSWPLRSYRITSRFGEADIEFHRQFFHGGVDLAAPYGTPIYAAAGGTVTRSGPGEYGTNVYVDTGSALIIYGHMSRTGVSVGETVRRGEVLGYVGCSGICTGPHLHFEVRLNGQPVDPLGLLP